MKKSKNLTVYKRRLPAKRSSSMPIGTIITIIVIGLVIYLIIRNRASPITGTYQNTKKWVIKRDEDGFPIEITKIVNAKVV